MNLLSKTVFPAAIFLLQGWTAAAAQSDPSTYSIEQCASFAELNFDIYSYENYENYFDESSTIILAQTGTYTGPASIEEYVRFTDETSPWIDKKTVLSRFPTKVTGFDPTTGICKFTTYIIAESQYNPSLTTGNFVASGVILNIFYSIPAKTISSIQLYYTSEVFVNAFKQFQTVEAFGFICDTLLSSSCSDALGDAAEQGLSIKQCVERISNLPLSEGKDSYIDSNTQGCRMLHVAFAVTNDFHCPHLSLIPAKDDNGNTKCQISENILPTDLFTQTEIDGLLEVCANSPDVDDKCFRIVENQNPRTSNPKQSKKKSKRSKKSSKYQKNKKSN